MKVSHAHLTELYELLSSIDTTKEAAQLAHDLFTPQELKTIAERWLLIQELAAGTQQRSIARKLRVSVSKITRGSIALQEGGGGFAHFLKKLKKKVNALPEK